ncbi:MAG: YdcF family protein [Kiritimatiellae bacterium]|jgi:uncharacterized SAM-binding protein YcdF (DUF218 family)|nr:YdcF family protein [Kiritimatiellia bacterium]NLD91009.1 YdcF family protein [Lentisphaerota bacterium]HPC19565.1 YdcF family protein [Kiritimatiellia bacterium]HQN79857.1 YdcF family protein [Kiritimatiellia bacterium]HQQ61191.1 YdcF family protein [Kiritimatiellia bacterium]
MKSWSGVMGRGAGILLALLGLLALLLGATQFTSLPWRAYQALAQVDAPFAGPPTHILVMGGSGIPGESGLSRIFFGAEAAKLYHQAEVLLAMPLGTNESFASRAYAKELRLRGVPAKRIHVIDGGRNTHEQALRVAEALNGHSNAIQILVVSDPYHVRRTAACLRKAFADHQRNIPLAALPVFPLSIEDPFEFRLRELDAPPPSPAPKTTAPDLGSFLQFRYNLWNNCSYSLAVLRESSALLCYRLRGWI